ncbi:cryptochrome/photolyase family protein [Aquibium sp. A9E412]|uniref:cryptochrome/photolyase family protein n=1 Tax=Aquibium sp. A9E412 TaxID=2976767 RepID=UPI0025B17AF5|nr:cryptochrome/photolyase family protein [Aquibium sp. A9E412]MDN2564988.1 cryptochrome/photolyase family protein [Aquibium sp. A9E412]
MVHSLRLVLGDQLSRGLSALADLDPADDVVLMAEVAEEAGYVPHHKKKLAFVFSAMRHFAEALRAEGIAVDYRRLDGDQAHGSLGEALAAAVAHHRPQRIVMTEPGEWRVLAMMRDWRERFDADVEIRADNRFLASHEDFRDFAEDGRKTLRMEHFYRLMRRRTGYLMHGEAPEGGRWNLDADNRRPLPADIALPERPAFAPDRITRAVLAMVEARFGDNFGRLTPFAHPVTRADALASLDWFVANALPFFGDYQDAMRQGAPLLFHSQLSALLNCGLLDPRECCRRAEDAYHAGAAPLNAVEGFIRQIVGWREFVRGIYWLKMPDYAQANALDARRPLPDFFWTAETEMNCLAQAIGETRDNAYAHHIQRLMVIGNFCLLAGLDPVAVQQWYLLVYHDAYEWVEMPNVVGMILYADGGLFASKPYAASGSYIDRMSDYCGRCRYDVKRRTGPDACPFNHLYWDFLARNRDRLKDNRRLAVVYRTLERMDPARREAMRRDAARFLEALA